MLLAASGWTPKPDCTSRKRQAPRDAAKATSGEFLV